MIPKFRYKAHPSAKALLCLASLRQSAGRESDNVEFGSTSCRDWTLGFGHGIHSRRRRSRWQNFSFSVPHARMGHVPIRRARDVLREGRPSLDDAKGFALLSLTRSSPSCADCSGLSGRHRSGPTLMACWFNPPLATSPSSFILSSFVCVCAHNLFLSSCSSHSSSLALHRVLCLFPVVISLFYE